MPVYECLFFANGRVEYLENLECSNEASLRPLLQQLLAEEEWDAAEAWRHDKLVCQVIRFGDGRIDCSLDCPRSPVYQSARGLM
jgi:hypothetical protein